MVTIILPSQYEINYLKNIFNIKNILSYFKDSLVEAVHPEVLINYKWNGTYLYKWSYLHLKLWKTKYFRKPLEGPLKGSYYFKIFYMPFYLLGSFSSLLFSILSFPVIYISRISFMLVRLFKRLTCSEPIPNLLTSVPE